jgi:hypothetical protein
MPETAFETLLRLLDLAAIIGAMVSAWFWLQASGRMVRRVRREEPLDSTDFNRLVTVLNRTQVLNARAALATGVSALILALRYALGLFSG